METLSFVFTSSFYPPYCTGGDAFSVKFLAEALAKKGHAVKVIHSIDAFRAKTSRKISAKKDPLVETIGLKTRFPLIEPSLAFFSGNSPMANNAFKKALEEKPDIVHHHNISLLGYGLLEKKGAYRNIYTAHDDWIVKEKHFQLWRHSAGFKKAVSSLDFIISPSNWLKQKLSKKISNKIFVLPNFVPEPGSIKKLPGKFFLFVGSLEKEKGIMELLEAAAETKEKIVIAGTGSMESKARNFIQKHCLQDNVSLLGWVEHNSLYSLYSEAKALVLPSKLENCPLVVLEAMSVGTATISSDACGLPEIMKKLDSHLVFRQNNLNQKMLNYKEQDPEKTRRVFEENFSEKAFMKKYSRLLK